MHPGRPQKFAAAARAFNQIFLKDLRDYAAMNYCIRADLVKPEFLVEVASVAHL